MYKYYKRLLGDTPEFLKKYFKSPSLKRLKKVGYFCGMDYASKNIYDFGDYISRYDHSLTVALLTYKLSKNKKATISALFHDVSTPCFSRVIDYMNKDYSKQESTEEYTEHVILNDKYLLKCLEEDNIKPKDIINFKKYTIVDIDRPALCADRIDGIILTGIYWCKNITKQDIKNIVESLVVYKNENNQKEIGFKNKEVAKKVIEINKSIDILCHSNEDNYMMELLSKITKLGIDNNYYTYNDLFTLNEEKIFRILNNSNNKEIKELLKEFYTIKEEDIPITEILDIKRRNIKPIVENKRIN